MEMVPEWLNYGALGLLALVLGAGFFLVRDILRRFVEAGKFTEALAENAIGGMREIVAENQRIMAEYAAAQRETARALESLNTLLDKAYRQSTEGHKKLSEEHKEILRAKA